MNDELRYLRSVIDNIDRAFVHMIATRFRITERIGQIKGEMELPVRDEQREKDHIRAMRETACTCGLEPDLAEKVIRSIMTEATEHHKRWQKN